MNHPILETKPDRINKIRKTDDAAASLLGDIVTLIEKGDNLKAAQAAGYLLLHLAAKASIKPFTLLRSIYRAS